MRELVDASLAAQQRADGDRLDEAASLLLEAVTADDFATFATTRASVRQLVDERLA